jgi:hypothetical protein
VVTNGRDIRYVPVRLRSKSPTDFGRRFVVWFVQVRGGRFQVGQTGDLLAHGRDRGFDNFRYLGGDWQPRRQFHYWSE